MPRVALVAALEREVGGLIHSWNRVEREHEGRRHTFFERDDCVVTCGGIGVEAARRAAEAVIALYAPGQLQSVGFAGALDSSLHVGDIFVPARVMDSRDGSRIDVEGGTGVLLTSTAVAGVRQKAVLVQAYGANAVDMEAAAVAAVAHAHGIRFGATKVISDECDFELSETENFIDSRGKFKTRGFALFAAMRPWLWRRVALLAVNSRKAERILSRHLKAHSAAA